MEESPFLTLQEVETISKQKIASVHAGRNVPKVDNPTWKSGTEESAAPAAMYHDDEAAGATSSSHGKSPTEVESTTGPPGESEAHETPDSEPAIPYIGHQIPEDFLKKAGLLSENGERESEMRPIYQLNADGSLPRK